MVALFNTAFPFSFPWPAHVFAVLNKYPNPLAPHVISVDVVDRTLLEDGTVRSERLLGVQQDAPRWVNRLLGSEDVTYVREVSFVIPSGTPNPNDVSEATVSNALLEPPKLLMASTNLTLASLLQCRESISYLPHPWPHLPPATEQALAPVEAHEDSSLPKKPPPPPADEHPLSHPSMPPNTLFSQSALIFSTGMFASSPYPPIGISSSSPIIPLSQPRASTAPQRAAGRKVESWSAGRFEMNAEAGRGAMQWAAKKFWEQEAKMAAGLARANGDYPRHTGGGKL